MSVNFDKNSNSFFLYGTDAFNLNIDDEPYDIEPFNNPLTQDENIKLEYYCLIKTIVTLFSNI